MPRRRRRPKDRKDLYKSIRKPVAPPTKVEEDRRRKIRKAQARREAEEVAREGDADVSGS
jgi:hypothetical protein